MLLISYSGHARNNQRLPDSVKVDDTVSFDRNEESTVTIKRDSTVTENTKEDSVVFRVIPDSIISSLKKSKEFAYANDPEYWVKEPKEEPDDTFNNLINRSLNSRWFRFFLLLLFGSILIFALYKIIAENRLYLFYKKPTRSGDQQLGETEITFDDLEEKIHTAIASNDFCTAVRFMYIKALKKAGERGLILLHADATNQEYVTQMANHRAGNDFRFLTYAYDYVWYGGFPITPEQFSSLQSQFTNLYNNIDH